MYRRDHYEAVLSVAAERNETFSDVVKAALDAYLPLVMDWKPVRLPAPKETRDA